MLGKVLDGVAAYTVSHFANEESLMKRYAYPDYARHKAEHDKLVDRVEQLRQDFRTARRRFPRR